MKRAKLNDKIKFVKKVFGTPYHFFGLGVKSNLIVVRFEDKYGKHYEFTSGSMIGAVIEAENYVMEQIKAGFFEEPKTKK